MREAELFIIIHLFISRKECTMPKVAIVILADTETHESLGRVVNALEAVKEFKDGQPT
jgi:hypothetical protein